MENLSAWLESEQWQGGYKPFPQKYLNSGLYQQLPVNTVRASSNGHHASARNADGTLKVQL